MNIVVIPPGVSEIKHTHPGPLSVYVLEGTLTLEHEGRPTATYKPGEAVLIEAGKIHRGINSGDVPVKIVASLISEMASRRPLLHHNVEARHPRTRAVGDHDWTSMKSFENPILMPLQMFEVQSGWGQSLTLIHATP
jgi:uncharacterized cupin superfamily protein